MAVYKKLLITLSFLSLSSYAAGLNCQAYFNQEKTAQVQDKKTEKDLDLKQILVVEGKRPRLSLGVLVETVGDLAQKNGRVPSIEEISQATGVEQQMLRGYFSKASSPKVIQIVAMAKAETPELFKRFEAIYAAEAIKYLKKSLKLPEDSYMAELLKVTLQELRVIYGSNKGAIDRMREHESKALDTFRDKVLIAYTKAAKQTGRSPSLEEVALYLEVTPDTLKELIGKNKLFEKFEDIFEVARTRNPNAFKNVQNINIFTPERLDRALEAAKKGDVLVITSAVAGAPVNQGFYNALKAYHGDRNAPVFIRPVNLETSGLQADLLESDFAHVLINTMKLTSKLSLHNLKLIAKMVDPLTGMKKLGAGETRIFGHIQRRLETRAHVDSSLEPLFLMTTGALTEPNYIGGRYIQERTGEMATERHFYGAVILEKTSSRRAVEIPGLGRFHIRMIEYVHEIPNESGQMISLEDPYFLDLNKKYYASGKVEEVRLEALMFGDLHFGATDQHAALEAKRNLIRTLKPRRIYTEDDYDGKEINHHERERIITQGMLALMKANSLEEGLHYLRENLEAILDVAPSDTVIIRKRSNHPHWVERYIQSGAFMKESQNTTIGIELAKAMNEGMDPIEYFLKKTMSPELFKRVVTLRAGEPVSEGSRPITVHMHGDKGINGARGSINAFIEATAAAIFGHTHYMQIYNRIMNIAAMAAFPQPYAKEGFSKAMISNAGIGQNGEAQFYIYDSISGEYFRDMSRPLDAPDKFFAPGFPHAVPTYDPTGKVEPSSGTLDQYKR